MQPATPAPTLEGRLTVDLDALARNWQALDKVSATALTSAVVKADAYGTGLVMAARALARAGARFFFVATPDEGLQLRNTLDDAHIFVLNGLYPGAAPLYVSQRLMPVLSTMAMLDEWLGVCVETGEAFPAALHFDTGMNRLGFPLKEASLVRQAIDARGYQPQMIMSHFACADVPAHEKNRTQLALFQSILAQFPGIPASLANSAGLMNRRENHFQMVRPGVALYGGLAVSGRPNPMSHVVTLEAPILQIKTARTGESVGYGATQTLNRDSRVAVISHGYADGFFRALSSRNGHTGGMVAINGQLAPVLGRVSMDLISIDITDIDEPPPLPGAMVEILGPTVGVDMQAESAGTIGYEVLTSLKGRYQRTYVEGEDSTPVA